VAGNQCFGGFATSIFIVEVRGQGDMSTVCLDCRKKTQITHVNVGSYVGLNFIILQKEIWTTTSTFVVFSFHGLGQSLVPASECPCFLSRFRHHLPLVCIEWLVLEFVGLPLYPGIQPTVFYNLTVE
jgi:hypothetical protein